MASISIALCVVTAMIPATPVCADAALDWNACAANAIVTVGGQVPPRALIRLAMVHLAIYDAAIKSPSIELPLNPPQIRFHHGGGA